MWENGSQDSLLEEVHLGRGRGPHGPVGVEDPDVQAEQRNVRPVEDGSTGKRVHEKNGGGGGGGGVGDVLYRDAVLVSWRLEI